MILFKSRKRQEVNGLPRAVRRPLAFLLGLFVIVVIAATPSQRAAIAVEPSPTPKVTASGEIRQTDNVLPTRRQARDNDIKFERISLEQGLSGSTVFCILQDSKGFMWFGTRQGLNKYNGYEFETYRHEPENLHSLGSDVVWTIYEDRMGVL
ncbi:MAG: hypothetical protein GY832_16235, partial [Chloroflexi bacterium]|nr:hypothetical protein [Chloroflexota bacterium]